MTAAQGNLWTLTAGPLPDTAPLDGDLHVDLAVIGGGFTGLSAALHAAEAGLSVVVIEAEQVGFGGSGRNVGLVNAGLWLPPGEVARIMGAEAGARLNMALSGGPSLVFDLIEKHQIRCEAVRQGTLHCAHSPKGFAELETRCAQLQGIGAPVSLIGAEEARRRTGSAQVHGALFDPRAGTIQPRAYAVGLARAAMAAGARIVQGARATGVVYRDDLWQMRVGGHRVTADALIEGTNAYGSARDRCTKMFFFQMATDPLPPALLADILPGGEGCWDTALVMTSFRRDAAGRVIIGSVGSLDHAGSGLHRAWARRKMEALYPQLKGVALAHEWYGTIATTGDHLPRVLRLGPRGYAVFGYSGRGIGTGTLFGRALAGAVVSGREDGLPVTPVDSYSEGFTAAKAAYYETGALAAHGAEMLRGH